MKKLLLISLLSISPITLLYGDISGVNICETIKEELPEPIEYNRNTSSIGVAASQNLLTCITFLTDRERTLKTNFSNIFNRENWINGLSYINEICPKEDEKNERKKQRAYINAENRYSEVKNCAYAFAVIAANYEIDRNSKEELATIKEMLNAKDLKSMSHDNKIECQASGFETLDYNNCKVAATTYSSIYVGKQIKKQVDVAMTQKKATESNIKALTDPNDTANYFEAEQEKAETAKNLSTQNAGIDTAAMMLLGGMALKMEDVQDLVSECTNHLERNVKGESIFDFFVNTNNQGGCNTAVGSGKFDFILNQQAKQQILQIAASHGIEATSSAATAYMMKDRAEKLGNAVEDLRATEEDLENQFDSMTIEGDLCVINPSHPSCTVSYDMGSSETGFSDTEFNLSSSGSNTLQGSMIDGDPGNLAVNDNLYTGDGINLQDSAYYSGKVNKGGGIDSLPGKASAKISAVDKSGGGGGGTAGGASAPGGGTGVNNKDSSGVSSYKASKVNIGSSGGMKFSSVSSQDSSNNSGSSSLEKLFGSQTRKPASGDKTTTFKESIGAQNGTNIFGLISNRYDTVSQRNDLLEYK